MLFVDDNKTIQKNIKDIVNGSQLEFNVIEALTWLVPSEEASHEGL